MSSAKFALAAAHNITPRTVASWNPLLARTPRVMVPIHLDVMMVRNDGEKWANCRMAEPDPNADLQQRRDLLPDPFSELEKPRPRGAYLHWALPDALTHGTSDGKTGKFYAIPDRWLVLRLFPGGIGARRAVTGWVIRAGDKTPSVTPLDQWLEKGASADPVKNALTALGHGDPAWAAYYDNVVTADSQGNQLPRLGFYDNLSGVSGGPLAYVVCGWYSDSSLDPLGDPNIHSLYEFDSTMNSLLWHIDDGEFHEAIRRVGERLKAANLAGLQTLEFTGVEVKATSQLRVGATTSFKAFQVQTSIGATPSPLDNEGHPVDGSYTTNGAWWPKGSFYHGSVVGIGWPGVGWPEAPNGILGKPPQGLGTEAGEFGGPPQSSSIHVAVGNTVTEALGALVAQTNKSPEEAQMLEAYLLGALSEVDKADGQAHVDALLHAASFATRDGGFYTEEIHQPAMPDLPPPKPAPITPDPGVFANQRHSRPPHAGFTASDALSKTIGLATPVHNAAPDRVRESIAIKGGLREVISSVFATPLAPTIQPAKTITVQRAKPRFFQPADPVLLVQGAARSFKHGGDGRFTQDGKLICRLTGFCITELACNALTGQPIRPSVSGDDILERGVENGSVPNECEDILREVALADPGSASVAAQASGVGGRQAAQATKRFMVEQTAVWAARDPRFDAAPLVARSGFRGTLPSPISINLPVRPWNPIHLDWEVEYVASPGGASDWSLDETDYVTGKSPDTPGTVLRGRAHLSAGAAATAAQAVRTALRQAAGSAGTGPLAVRGPEHFYSDLSKTMLIHLDSLTTLVTKAGSGTTDGGTTIDRSVLDDIVSALDNMDVLSGAMDNFHTRLRGGLKGDGISVPTGPVPSPFVAIRSGFLKIRRLRLVDGFGQFVDLAGSSDDANVDLKQILTTGPAAVPNAPGLAAMPPRFTSPSRLWLRYLDSTDDTQDATTSAAPVCGYLLPNHIDGALEFFDNQGGNLGVVRPDAQAGIVWEDAPGTPSTLGTDPAHAISDTRLAGIAQALIQWGLSDAMLAGARDDALSALLRIIDSTLWSVDPFGHTGDEHLSLLVGHPIAVMRARVRLEVNEPVTPDVVNTTRVPLRLGALVHWQDGLLGYFVSDDYTTLYCADAVAAGFAREVGPNRGFLQQINLVPDFYQQFSNDLGANVTEGNSPVDHPFVDTSGLLWIAPNQDYILTLLVEPHSVVHATTGLLPRKDIGMRREWVADALAKIAPTFRFGPLLVDPKRIRMPVASEIKGTWSWDHRSDVAKWTEDPVINSTADAIIPPDPVEGTEGWLKLAPPPPPASTT